MKIILTFLSALCLAKGDHPHLALPQLQLPPHQGRFSHAEAHAEAHALEQSQGSDFIPFPNFVEHFHPHHPPPFQIEHTKQVPQKVTVEDLVEEEWMEFKLTFNKVYHDPEIEKLRKGIFVENRAKIARHNQEYSKGSRNFVQRINSFGDMLVHEFNQNLNGYNRSHNAQNIVAEIPPPTAYIPSANVIFPTRIDWRAVGAVTSVKNQQMCAGCWAFAAAGALEGQIFRKTGKLNDISAQNLMDCTRQYGNDGCEGGLMDPAFEYIRANKGVDGEASYPYEAKEQECRFKRENVVATTSGYVDLPPGDEQSLEIAVATLGPVTAALDASRDSLQFYSDGVYFDPECGNKPEQMNHAVLVVGYGVEPNGQKYWLVKNSYGDKWGIGGYIKIARNAGNHCGIATQASYPLV